MPVIEQPVPLTVEGRGQGIRPMGGVVNSWGGSMRLPSRNWVYLRQPWLDSRGRACVSIPDLKGRYTVNKGKKEPLLTTYLVNDLRNMGYPLPIVTNAVTMTRENWIEMERAIFRAFRQRLQAADDLSAASTYGGFNGLARMTLEYRAMSDPGEAVIDMDATTDARNDTPLAIIRSMPLPVIHCDFGFSQRELLVSESGDMPLDDIMIEAGGRRIGETVEDLVLGNVTGPTYGTQTAGPNAHTGTSTIYGYKTFPDRLTKTNFTAPTTGGWVPDTAFNEVLTAISQLMDTNLQYGPFVIYHSTDWSPYMNRVYAVSGGNNPGETLRTMLLKIPEVTDVRRLDRLTDTFTFLIVDMSGQTAQMVEGLALTTVQWEEKGGLELRFKNMIIRLPRMRADYNNRTGILHGTTA